MPPPPRTRAAFVAPSTPLARIVKHRRRAATAATATRRAVVRASAAETPPSPSSSTAQDRAAYARRARRLSDSFEPRAFTPYRSSNPQFQTILSNFWPAPAPVDCARVRLATDDGLAVVHIDMTPPHSLALGPHAHASTTANPLPVPPPLDAPDAVATDFARVDTREQAKPVVVVLHGLESNSQSVLVRRVQRPLLAAGFDVLALNYRGCGGLDDEPKTLRLYHAGFTDDVATLLRAIRHAATTRGLRAPPVYLCGFSLGANIALHLAARRDGAARDVAAVAVACAPFDPEACQAVLDRGWKGALYAARLVATMRKKFSAIVDAGAELGACSPEAVMRADRIGKIDDALISPVFGFTDRFDYYRRVDARSVLARIRTPTLVINARDDPFFAHTDGKSLPTAAHIGDAPVRVVVTDHGGHCGFLDAETAQNGESGYFQREFARFFAHVRRGVHNET